MFRCTAQVSRRKKLVQRYSRSPTSESLGVLKLSIIEQALYSYRVALPIQCRSRL
jgi:hypothetical protein